MHGPLCQIAFDHSRWKFAKGIRGATKASVGVLWRDYRTVVLFPKGSLNPEAWPHGSSPAMGFGTFFDASFCLLLEINH